MIAITRRGLRMSVGVHRTTRAAGKEDRLGRAETADAKVGWTKLTRWELDVSSPGSAKRRRIENCEGFAVKGEAGGFLHGSISWMTWMEAPKAGLLMRPTGGMSGTICTLGGRGAGAPLPKVWI